MWLVLTLLLISPEGLAVEAEGVILNCMNVWTLTTCLQKKKKFLVLLMEKILQVFYHNSLLVLESFATQIYVHVHDHFRSCRAELDGDVQKYVAPLAPRVVRR